MRLTAHQRLAAAAQATQRGHWHVLSKWKMRARWAVACQPKCMGAEV